MHMKNDIEYIDPLNLYRWDEENEVERSIYIERYNQYYDVYFDVKKPGITLSNIFNAGKPHTIRLFMILVLVRLSVLFMGGKSHAMESRLFNISVDTRGNSSFIGFGSKSSNYKAFRYVYKCATGEPIKNDIYKETTDYLGNLKNKSVNPDQDKMFLENDPYPNE